MTTPDVAPGFAWVTTPAGPVLTAAALDGLARHAFTTRGFGANGSAAPTLEALAAYLGVDRENIVRLRQVHGCDVAVIHGNGSVPTVQSADALVSDAPGRAVAVAVADCVPVLIADRRRRAVAAVHAGWRGTASRIVAAAVTTLRDAGIPATDLVGAIGPSIGPCCYQVDARVRDTFLDTSPGAGSWFAPDGDAHWKLDLWRANADQLAESGVPGHAIHVARFCTADHLDQCFSYRREGPAAGRMFAAIRLRPQP